MMKSVILATTNQRKLHEAQLALVDFEITVEQRVLDIDEIQSHDPIKIAEHKAKQAFALVGEPVVVTDTSWSIAALNGFPGGYMKDVDQWFRAEDFINLLKCYDNKEVSFTESIVYVDAGGVKIFSEEYFGKIVESRGSSNHPIERVAEFNGYTIAERHDQGSQSHEPKDYIWYQFANWFSKKDN